MPPKPPRVYWPGELPPAPPFTRFTQHVNNRRTLAPATVPKQTPPALKDIAERRGLLSTLPGMRPLEPPGGADLHKLQAALALMQRGFALAGARPNPGGTLATLAEGFAPLGGDLLQIVTAQRQQERAAAKEKRERERALSLAAYKTVSADAQREHEFNKQVALKQLEADLRADPTKRGNPQILVKTEDFSPVRDNEGKIISGQKDATGDYYSVFDPSQQVNLKRGEQWLSSEQFRIANLKKSDEQKAPTLWQKPRYVVKIHNNKLVPSFNNEPHTGGVIEVRVNEDGDHLLTNTKKIYPLGDNEFTVEFDALPEEFKQKSGAAAAGASHVYLNRKKFTLPNGRVVKENQRTMLTNKEAAWAQENVEGADLLKGTAQENELWRSNIKAVQDYVKHEWKKRFEGVELPSKIENLPQEEWERLMSLGKGARGRFISKSEAFQSALTDLFAESNKSTEVTKRTEVTRRPPIDFRKREWSHLTGDKKYVQSILDRFAKSKENYNQLEAEGVLAGDWDNLSHLRKMAFIQIPRNLQKDRSRIQSLFEKNQKAMEGKQKVVKPVTRADQLEFSSALRLLYSLEYVEQNLEEFGIVLGRVEKAMSPFADLRHPKRAALKAALDQIDAAREQVSGAGQFQGRPSNFRLMLSEKEMPRITMPEKEATRKVKTAISLLRSKLRNMFSFAKSSAVEIPPSYYVAAEEAGVFSKDPKVTAKPGEVPKFPIQKYPWRPFEDKGPRQFSREEFYLTLGKPHLSEQEFRHTDVGQKLRLMPSKGEDLRDGHWRKIQKPKAPKLTEEDLNKIKEQIGGLIKRDPSVLNLYKINKWEKIYEQKVSKWDNKQLKDFMSKEWNQWGQVYGWDKKKNEFVPTGPPRPLFLRPH